MRAAALGAALLLALQHELHAWQPSPLTALNAAIAEGESAAAPDSILSLIERSRLLVEASDGLFVGGPAQFAALVERLQLGCALMLTEENELLITRALQPRLRLQRNPVALGAPVDSGSDCTPPTR